MATERAPDRVVVIGSANIDHVVEADAFPAPGETLTGRTARTGLGGKGSNQAVAAALAGEPAGVTVAMIARVGADDPGRRARDGLAARGVDVGSVHAVAGSETGTAWITVAAGDNTIVVVPGANHEWPGSGDPLDGAGTGDTVVLAQLEIPIPVVVRAARHCRGRFLLNAAPAAVLPDELLARCDVLIVNEHEQSVVSGVGDRDADGDGDGDGDGDAAPVADGNAPPGAPDARVPGSVRRAHGALRERGVAAVVTTLGAAGAVVTDATGSVAVPAPAVDRDNVIDTTGAGDAFAGTLAARLAAGDTLAEAARWGACAGSLAVRATGAQESYADGRTLAGAVRAAAS